MLYCFSLVSFGGNIKYLLEDIKEEHAFIRCATRHLSAGRPFSVIAPQHHHQLMPLNIIDKFCNINFCDRANKC